MAHPKRKISRTRRDKRRTHYKATTPQIATCPTTGEAHLYHRAHWHEGKLYYRGQVLVDTTAADENAAQYVFACKLIKNALNERFFCFKSGCL